MMRLGCTYWRSLVEPIGKPFSTTWLRLGERFATPFEASEKAACPGWSPARFRDDRRALANVLDVSALVFDFDEVADGAGLVGAFKNAAIVHATFSSKPTALRARAILLLSRPVTVAEHGRLWRHCATVLERAGQKIDLAAKDASRLSFIPACPIGQSAAYRISIVEGPALDVDKLLASIPDPAPTKAPAFSSGQVPAEASVLDRARKYLQSCPIAISGSGGHNTTFNVCQKLTRGFGLDAGTAFDLLLESGWAAACQPPWSVAELGRKVNESASAGRMVLGSLRDAPRRKTG